MENSIKKNFGKISKKVDFLYKMPYPVKRIMKETKIG